jgi:hypothetical protein
MNIVVYCGSSSGIGDKYLESAIQGSYQEYHTE